MWNGGDPPRGNSLLPVDKLARASLRNRPFVALVCVVASVLGVLSLQSMRRELIPPVELPAVSVIAISPGATSEQMNERIAVPIEQQVATIPEVKSTTTSSSSSYAMITVELEYGTDTARATAKVEQAVSRADTNFPEDTTTEVTSGASSDIPLAMIGVTSDSDALQTADNIRTSVVPQLEKIDGVASATLVGAPEQRVTIELNAEAAAANGVTTQALQDAMDSNGLAVPVGTVAEDGKNLDVTVGQRIDSLDALRAIPVITTDPATGETNGSVPLGDVASVELTGADAALSARIDGKSAVALVVYPTSNANIVDTSHELADILTELQPLVGGDAEFTTIFDQAPFITDSISSLAEEGVMGLVMAVVVILLFLLSLRSTLVTAISIPLSLLIGFIGMRVAGYSLNILTLSALTITIGRVVDDSIVVIENIKRHMEYGGDRRAAITNAVREVASAITASTIVTCLVFLPIGFISGMVGELFRPFALTVVLAMAASLFTALTIVPVLAYWFLRPSHAARAAIEKTPQDTEDAATSVELSEQKDSDGSVVGADQDDSVVGADQSVPAISPASADEDAVRLRAEEREENTWLRRMYRPVLRGTQRHPVVTLLVAIAVLAGTGALFPLLKVNLLGDTGQNMVSLSQNAPAGTDMETLTAHAQTAEAALERVDGVETVATTIASTGMNFGGASISYTIVTDPDADQEALRDELERTLQDNASGDVVSAADITGLTSSAVEVNLVASDDDALAAANDVLLAQLQDVSGAKTVSSNLATEQPSVKITVDRDAAAAAGMTENDVVGMISAQIVAPSIGQITLNNVDTDIYVKLDSPAQTIDDLRNLQIAGQPISAFATVEEVSVVPTVVTVNGQRTATITVTPEDADDLGALRTAVNNAVDSADLPSNVMTVEAGAGEQIGDVFGQLGLALAAAILIIYVVLVFIFKSLGQPLLLLISIPFAATGAFLVLLAADMPLGISSLVGILMLTGIVVTNAIVLIDLINQLRRDGMGLDEAISIGAQRRLRPIIMTAVSTIAALLPMAFGVTGYGGFISQPMAITVIGGLTSSTILTLVLLPVLYRLTQQRGERKRSRRD